MAASQKTKVAPAEPFKRALGLCVRAIAGDEEVQVGFGPGRPELEGKTVSLPEPSRVPSQREISVIRGWADSLALTAACHDTKVHTRLAPQSGPAREVFEAVERARVEALGANRMAGMARNLTAKIEDHFAHGRFAQITQRDDAPLDEALALIVRERLTGLPPPPTAKALVEAWRPWVEQRAAKVLDKMDRLADDQESFGRLLRDLLKALELADDLDEGRQGEDENEEEGEAEPRGGEEQSQDEEQGEEGRDEPRQEETSPGDLGEAQQSAEPADADELDLDSEGLEESQAPQPWRPSASVLDHPEAFGYAVFTRAFDEEVAAEDLSSPDELERLHVPRQGAAQPVERRRPPRQPPAAPVARPAEPRLGLRPRGGRARRGAPAARRRRSDAPALLQARARHRLPRHGGDLLLDNSGSMRGR